MFDHIEIREGMPPKTGLYVAYVNDEMYVRAAKRMMLQWHEGSWWYPLGSQRYRSHVYGWIGPLPFMPLHDGDDTPQKGGQS